MSILITLNLQKKNKKFIYLLTSTFGLGYARSMQICKQLGVDLDINSQDLKEADLNKLNSIINLKYKYIIDSDLKKQIYDNIKHLKQLRTYKGSRHFYKLPANGQRTHTNAKTAKWK